MNIIHTLKMGSIAAGAMMLLNGCVAGWNVDAVRDAKPTGSAFTQAMHKEYVAFVNSEAKQEDWFDADHFAKKGVSAAAGTVVQPEDPGLWDEPADKMDDLVSARAKLMKLLDIGGRDMYPDLSAVAQAKYDCWVEQQEENHQPTHITECKDEFFDALYSLRDLLLPEKEYVIYFNFDRYNLTAAAMKQVKEIAAEMNSKPYAEVVLVGHTDLVGTEAYNMELSKKRAITVRDQLKKLGVNDGRIVAKYAGESQPAVPTKHRERRNRRVYVVLHAFND